MVLLLRLICRKVFQLLLVTIMVTFAAFLLSSLIPGDFYSTRQLDPNVRPEIVAQLRQTYGLDQPIHRQYLRWIRQAASLDLGPSLYYQAPVRSVCTQALLNTLWIGLPALILGISTGVLAGSLHSLRTGKPLGWALDVLSSITLSLPVLILALSALILAARTHWFPLGGMNAPQMLNPGWGAWWIDRLHHLVLPLFCLAVPIAAYVERIQFAAATETLQTQVLRAARARGLDTAHLFFNHLLRPSLIPVLAVSGPLFGAVLSGSLLIETIFSWPGLGQVTYEALFSRDLFLLVGCVTVTSLLLMMGSLISDLLCLAVDPRMRTATGGDE
jgi:peptide/nickel transport system permease protein